MFLFGAVNDACRSRVGKIFLEQNLGVDPQFRELDNPGFSLHLGSRET
jgi:hypothetical protein